MNRPNLLRHGSCYQEETPTDDEHLTMSIWEAIVLGFVQGATEYAPVSSSGHLILVPWLFGWQQLGGDADFAKTFDVALHMGTLLGAVIYFRNDLWRYLRAWLHTMAARRIATTDERIAWALVIGTIPGATVGALAEERDPKEPGRTLADRGDAGDLRRRALPGGPAHAE